jgi:regulator of sigma E protease
MASFKFVLIILEVLLLFNLLIGVHELGHFLAAKWRGLKVDRFAIWFGKPIWKKKVNGVEYALGWIPAGGYVALPQMATMEAIEGKGESSGQPLPNISALDKIIVAVAGPLFSFLLAVVFACIVWQVGKPMNEGDNSTTIGWVDPTGPAAKAGLQAGDKIVEIDGKPVSKFFPPALDSVMWRIATSEEQNIKITYLRDNQQHTTEAIPYVEPNKWYERKALRRLEIKPEMASTIFEVVSNSPAALAGLKHGDRIIELNGNAVYNPQAVASAVDAMSNGPVTALNLTVQRGDEKFSRSIIPEKPIEPASANPSLGILGWEGFTNVTMAHPTPAQQVSDSVNQIFATLGAVFSPKSHIGVQQLGGAVMILRVYSNLFEDEHGWQLVLWFSVVLNVNLAMLNLLPFPVLDGGHILLALLETIRRRPVSAKLLGGIQTTCALLLIGFMLFIAFFDTGDWIRSSRENRDRPVVFAPKN